MNGNAPTNRLQLNFGFNDRSNLAAEMGRQFPTTPSTFPQPVFPNSAGQQQVWGAQQNSNGYGGADYFMNNPYSAAYQQNSNPPTPGGAPYRAPAYNDVTNGLARQFSHQNLGGNAPRSASPYGRHPSPTQRPRAAGAPGQQQYGSHLSPPMPTQNGASLTDEEPPPKNPDKYADNVRKKAKVSVGLVSTFFKDSVQRAKDRNVRYALGTPRAHWLYN